MNRKAGHGFHIKGAVIWAVVVASSIIAIFVGNRIATKDLLLFSETSSLFELHEHVPK